MVFTRWLVSPQEEESEEEPKLKYERLSNGVTEILQKDAASCMTVHDKVPPPPPLPPPPRPHVRRSSHLMCMKHR